jgi:hypothetical protein
MKRSSYPSFGVLIACIAAWFPLLAVASPANDAFANAQILAGATVDITGDNTAATLEAGEINPASDGGASVWYSWTAPATGWVTIHTSSNTPGNGLDTILALFSDGATINTAAMLGHNNESLRFMTDFPESVYPDSVGPSRMVFKATIGNTYKIAVHGSNGATGPFDLHIAAEPTPGFVVQSVNFSPGTVDVTSGPASSDATLSIETSTPFSYANLALLRPTTGVEIANADITDAELVSGTSTNGTYTQEITVPGLQPPGPRSLRIGSFSFALSTFLVWSSQGNDVVEDDYLLPQSIAILDVANTGTSDSLAPSATSVTGLPASIELAAGDAAFDLTLNITDDISGFFDGDLLFRNTTTGASHEIMSFDEFSRTAGNEFNGTYTLAVAISADYPNPPPGSYQMQLELRDASGNLRRYGPNHESLPGGSTTAITISATPPANDAFSARVDLGTALPANVSGTNRFATLETGESDLDDSTASTVWYQWTAPATGWVSVRADYASPFSRPILGVFTGSSVSALTEIGRSNRTFGPGYGDPPMTFLAQSGTVYQIAVCGNGVDFPQAGSFNLQIQSAAEPTARVTGFTLTPGSVDVTTGSQNVTVDVTMASAVEIFQPGDYLLAYLTPSTSTATPAVSAFISNFHRISGDGFNGTYRATLTIPGYQPAGVWNLIIETSIGGQIRRWTPQGENRVHDAVLIPQSGGSVQVIYTGPPELAAPSLVSVTGLPASANVTTPVPVTLMIALTDDASGLATGAVQLSRFFEGSLSSYGMATFDSANLFSGTSTNGVYQVTFNLTNFITPGTYQLEVQLTDGFGRQSRYGPYDQPFPGGSTTTVTIGLGGGGYPSWAGTQDFGSGGLSAIMDDPNHDGSPNLLCYAFNIAPLSQAVSMTPEAGNTAGLPAVSVVGSGPSRRLRIEYLQRITSGNGLTYRPQFCSAPGASGPTGWQNAGAGTPTPINADWQRVVIEDSVQGDPVRFGRVVVEYAAP